MPMHTSIGSEPTERHVASVSTSHIYYVGNSIGTLKGDGECQYYNLLKYLNKISQFAPWESVIEVWLALLSTP